MRARLAAQGSEEPPPSGRRPVTVGGRAEEPRGVEELFRYRLIRCVNCDAVLDKLGGVCSYCGYANRRGEVLERARRLTEERRLWWLYDSVDAAGG